MIPVIFVLMLIAIPHTFGERLLLYKIDSDRGIDSITNLEPDHPALDMVDIQRAWAYIDGNEVIVEVEFADKALSWDEITNLLHSGWEYGIDIRVYLTVGGNFDIVEIVVSNVVPLPEDPDPICFLLDSPVYSLEYSVEDKIATYKCVIPGDVEVEPPISGYSEFRIEVVIRVGENVRALDTAVTEETEILLDDIQGDSGETPDGGDSTGPVEEPVGDTEEPSEEPSDITEDIQFDLPIPFGDIAMVAAVGIVLGIVAYIAKTLLKGVIGGKI